MITIKRDTLGHWWLTATTGHNLTVIHLGNKPTISADCLRTLKRGIEL